MNNELPEKAYLPPEVARVYKIPKGTLANLRSKKRGPKYYKIGRKKIIYFAEDVERWLRSNPVETFDSIKR